MARIADVDPEQLTAGQRRIYDDIMRTRPRDKLSGPFSVWIHTPDIAEPADRLANCFRVNSELDKRLIELIVLLMCRHATVRYAWSVHKTLARDAGLTPETIEAIRTGQRPDLARDDERLVYDLVTELLATKTLAPATFERAKAALGRDGVIEAVSCAGFYAMVGLVLNAFDVPAKGADTLG